MRNRKKTNRGRKILATVLIILAVLLMVGGVAVWFLQHQITEAYGTKNTTETESAVVTIGSISTTISGSGTLASEEVSNVTLPSGILIQSLCVDEDDSVLEGSKIANLNLPSVLSAMNVLQEELDELDEEIADASKDTVSSTVRSSMKGRVKAIYCAAGDSVLSVMTEYGCLAVISLDGYMAVDLPSDILKDGESVTVVLSDGTVFTGTADSSDPSRTTVLITDNKPLLGDTVSVYDAEENLLGTGELYVHEPLNITGYAGTVSRINTAENRSVYANGTLFTLKDTAYTANYDSLLTQRAELESELNDLIALYRAGAIYSPISGKIENLYSEEEIYDSESNWIVATVCPQDSMIVSATVDESDILAVSVGQAVEVTVSSISDDPFEGEVTAIEKTGTSSNGVTSYAVEVSIARTEEMFPNMSASIAIRIDGVDNALLLPSDAVTNTRDSAYVYTSVDPETGDLSGRTEVTTGLTGGGYIEITDGLSEGDTVYYTAETESDFSQFFNSFSSGGGMMQGGNNGNGGSGRTGGSGNSSRPGNDSGSGQGGSRRSGNGGGQP